MILQSDTLQSGKKLLSLSIRCSLYFVIRGKGKLLLKTDLKNIKPKIERLAKEYKLSLVLLYGSQAKGEIHFDSDVDIAVMGVKPISTDKLIALSNDLAQILEVYEIDVKSLHNTDALFRYNVMLNSVLLYGQSYDYFSLKAYAFRDYHDSKDLFRLKETLVTKRIKSFNIET